MSSETAATSGIIQSEESEASVSTETHAAEAGVAETVRPERPLPETGLEGLSSDDELAAACEAVLLVVDVPASADLLAEILEQPAPRVETTLAWLAESYRERGSGIDLRKVADGWRLYTRQEYAPYVERYLLDGQRARLTRAALETLAVIAYRQPVSRSKVARVRGVNVDGVIRTLLARGLIEEAGNEAATGAVLYRTGELFLERLGLSSLEELPALAPLLPEVDSIDDLEDSI